MNFLKLEPVRVYSVLSALIALAAHYVPGLPVPLVLAILAAAFGVSGELVRSRVTPTENA